MRRFVDMAFDNSDNIERIVTERYTIDNNKDTDFGNGIYVYFFFKKLFTEVYRI